MDKQLRDGNGKLVGFVRSYGDRDELRNVNGTLKGTSKTQAAIRSNNELIKRIVTGKQIGRASCRERVYVLV